MSYEEFHGSLLLFLINITMQPSFHYYYYYTWLLVLLFFFYFLPQSVWRLKIKKKLVYLNHQYKLHKIEKRKITFSTRTFNFDFQSVMVWYCNMVLFQQTTTDQINKKTIFVFSCLISSMCNYWLTHSIQIDFLPFTVNFNFLVKEFFFFLVIWFLTYIFLTQSN